MAASLHTSLAEWARRGRRWRRVAIFAGACVGLLAGLLFVAWKYRVEWWPTNSLTIELFSDAVHLIEFAAPQHSMLSDGLLPTPMEPLRYSIDPADHLIGPFHDLGWPSFADIIEIQVGAIPGRTDVIVGLWMPLAASVLVAAFSAPPASSSSIAAANPADARVAGMTWPQFSEQSSTPSAAYPSPPQLSPTPLRNVRSRHRPLYSPE